MNVLRRFIRDESGATAIEYGLIAALVAVACIGILSTLGTTLSGTFSTINTKLTAANGAAAS